MGLLVILSPLLIYLGAKTISSSSRVGIIAVLIYTLSGTIWFDSIFDSGLYANFIGILAALFLVFVIISGVRYPKSPITWIVFLLAVVNAYFSHYTILSIFPALVLFPIVQYLLRKPDVKSYAVFGFVATFPPLIPLLIFPSLAKIVIPLLSSGRGAISGSTALSNAFSSIPVLSSFGDPRCTTM